MSKTDLQVKTIKPTIGIEYPVYGYTTCILNEHIDNFTAIINYNMKVKMRVNDENTRQILLERLFEPGIFIVTICKINDISEDDYASLVKIPTTMSSFPYEGSCSTVIYGKKQEFDA